MLHSYLHGTVYAYVQGYHPYESGAGEEAELQMAVTMSVTEGELDQTYHPHYADGG